MGRTVWVLFFLGSLVIVLDRTAWAAVSIWREDQATKLWLGYTHSLFDAPVGGVSSVGLPSPNGLLLISALLSRLPSLWTVSAVLGVVQAGSVVWFSCLSTRDLRLGLLAAGPVLASITLRSGSVELWGLWTAIPLNLLFMGGLLLYIRSRTPWALIPVAAALVVLPSLYFSGLVNSIAFTILALAAGFRWRPSGQARTWLAPVLVTLAILGLLAGLIWIPYFRAVDYSGLSDAGSEWFRTPFQRLRVAVLSILAFPAYSLAQFAGSRLYSIGQVEPGIISPVARLSYEWLLRQTWIQAVLCYLSVLAAALAFVRRPASRDEIIRPEHRLVVVMVVLMVCGILLSYGIAPLIGGPAWGAGERLDQVAQFLPFMLMAWFLTPALLQQPNRLQQLLRRLTLINAVVYTTASLVGGLLVVNDNLRYRGDVLSRSDVPVVDKQHLVAFVAEDWQTHSTSKLVPIDYDLADGLWDWVSDFGDLYLEWYPAPYTIGRAFDYALLRGYGLHNLQEGIQHRTFGGGRYLVSYAFKPPPETRGQRITVYEFGRLRLTIQDSALFP